MSHRWTFDAAIQFWREHYHADPEPVWDRFTAAEAFILDHMPRSGAEAEQLFEVLLEQGPDARGDGRDREALQRIRAYVRQLHPAEAAAEAA